MSISEELFPTVLCDATKFEYEFHTTTQRLKTGAEDPLPNVKNSQREHLHLPCQALQEVHYKIKYFDHLMYLSE